MFWGKRNWDLNAWTYNSQHKWKDIIYTLWKERTGRKCVSPQNILSNMICNCIYLYIFVLFSIFFQFQGVSWIRIYWQVCFHCKILMHVKNHVKNVNWICIFLAADNLPNVDIHWEHKLVDLDMEITKLNFKVYEIL